MVFRAERYPADWKRIRAEILLRAGNVCERCRAPNGVLVARGAKGTRDEGTYMLDVGSVRCAETGEDRGVARGSEFEADRFVVIVLTVAHVDHDESNNDPQNLRALCQRCHLKLDAHDNALRRRANARRNQGVLPGMGGA